MPQINHVILTVSDLEKTRAFYSGLLGFEIRQFDNMLYTVMDNHCSLWFVTHKEKAECDFSEFQVGLDHLAFTAPSKAFLDEIAVKLQDAGVQTNGVEVFHGNWYYVAFRDPDNIQLEYWLDEPINKP